MQWVVYDHPRDYPHHFVLRRWEVSSSGGRPTKDVFVALTLEAIRDMVPAGLVRLARFQDDDPAIVEVWL